jgi:CAAX protease family protein
MLENAGSIGARAPIPLKYILFTFLGVTLLEVLCDIFIIPYSVAIGLLCIEVGAILAFPLITLRLLGFHFKKLLPFRNPGGKRLVVAVILTLAGAVILAYIRVASYQLMPGGLNLIGNSSNVMIAYGWNDFFMKLVLLCIIAPFCEEILFRGLIQGSFRFRFGNWSAILITAILFALMHALSFEPHLYLILGILFSWIYSVTGSLRVPIICHAINNTWALANQIRNFSFPVEETFGLIDVALIAAALTTFIAGAVYLERRGKSRD